MTNRLTSRRVATLAAWVKQVLNAHQLPIGLMSGKALIVLRPAVRSTLEKGSGARREKLRNPRGNALDSEAPAAGVV